MGSMFYLAHQTIILDTLHGRGKILNTVTLMPYLSIDGHYPTPPAGYHIRFSLYPRRGVPPAACYLHEQKGDLGLSLGETLLEASNLPGLLVLRAYAIVRGKMFRASTPSRGLSRILDHHFAPNSAGLQVHVIF